MKSNGRRSLGRCEACRGPLVRGRASVYRHRGKLHILFERVPALVCRECGRRIFEAAAVEAMERKLEQPSGRKRTARLLVLSA